MQELRRTTLQQSLHRSRELEMTISKEQTKLLLGLVAGARPDELDCEHCFDMMAEFVEHELADREIPDAYQVVKNHLDQCACCNDEHEALLAGLRALDESDQ